MNPPPAPAIESSSRRDYALLAMIAGAVSMVALLWCYRSGLILLYGDAVAHINIARRVFDSRTPGLFQLGTVWLPLPHLLDIPFITGDELWRTGAGASIPSMIAYAAGALGLFRVARGLASRTTAWVAALIYVFNPNLIYMQATAMTEALYLALFIWAVAFFSEFVREALDQRPEQARRAIERCAIALSAAMMVRYDAWFLAPVTGLAALAVIWKIHKFRKPVLRGVVHFFLLTSLTGALWLAYNQSAYANPLEFANGPYSARAIQQRSRTLTMPSYPGENSPRTAALYMLKVSRLNLGQGPMEYFLLSVAFVAWLGAVYFAHKFLPWTLLWTPLLFYVISIAWGSVPIYVPEWWPFSYYNVRYGLQLLPAVAVFVALGCEFAAKFLPSRWVGGVAIVMIGASYISVSRNSPICLREAEANGRARMEFDRHLALKLRKLPATATPMMDSSAHPGALQDAGIHYRRVLRESNPPFWEEGLTHPARAADYVIAIQGDDVARAVRLFPQDLAPVARVDTPQGPSAVIYRSMRVLQSGQISP